MATGAAPTQPRITGLNLGGVYPLHSMADSFAVYQHLTTRNPQSAVIIGGGYIGLDMPDALTYRNIAVTVVEHSASVLKTVDSSLGEIVRRELENHGIQVVNGVAVEAIAQQGTQLLLTGSQGFQIATDLVLVAVGVQPSTELAQSAGLAIGVRGAIRLNRAMATNVPDIYAAGECVGTWHRLLNQPTYLPLGTTAHKQGRIAGESGCGRESRICWVPRNSGSESL